MSLKKTNWSLSLTAVALIAAATLFFQNCQNNGIYMDDLGFDETGKLALNDATKCVDPLDPTRTIANGDFRLAFKSPAVDSDEYCHAEKRVCGSGKVFGSFKYASCTSQITVDGDCGSPFPGGNVVRNGSGVRAFFMRDDGTCGGSLRTCNNGVLTGKGNLVACPGVMTCMLPWGLQLTEGDHIITTDNVGTPKLPGACGVPETTWKCETGQIKTYVATGDCDPGACYAPWGTRVKNGAKIGAYKNMLRKAGECKTGGNFEERTCTNGTLGGTFSKGVCYDDRMGCTLPWGDALAHTQSVEAYQTSLATGGGACDKQILKCNNGNIEGPVATHTHKTCSVSTRVCGAPWDANEKHTHGTILIGYRESAVPAGTNCAQAQIQCIDGSWINGAIYKYKTCIVNPAACTTPWGAKVAHGAKIKAYAESYEQNNTGPTCLKTEMRECNDGVLNGTYTKGSCETRGDRYGGGGGGGGD